MERYFRLTIFILLTVAFVVEWRKCYFKHLGSYLRSFSVRSKLRFLVFPAGLLALVFCFDSTLLEFFQQWNHEAVSKGIMEFGRQIGRNINFWFGLVSIYALTLLFLRRWSSHVFGMILSSVLAGLLSGLMKFSFLRARPENNFGPYSFLNWPGITEDSSLFHSFPSGDVVLVAGAVGYLFFACRRSAVCWLVWLLPLSTAFSRMSLNRHWPSDTVMSLMLGAAFGWLVWDYHHRSQMNPTARLRDLILGVWNRILGHKDKL